MMLTEDEALTCEECGCPGMSMRIGRTVVSHAAHEEGCSQAVELDAA